MLLCRKHPTNRAEYVNKCKNRGFYAPTKATEFPEMRKRRTTATTTERHETTTEQHNTTTERAPSSTIRTKATEVPPNRECTPKVSHVQACQVSTHLKAPSKFPHAPQTEVFTRPNKPFKFPYPPKAPRSFTKA